MFRSRLAVVVRSICSLVLSVSFLMSLTIVPLSLTPLAMASDPLALITLDIPANLVDSHPYSVLIDDDHRWGYAAICGDVAPFGDPVESHSARFVVEFDARTLAITRTFEVGFYPTSMLLSDGHLWVSCSTESVLYRIDLDTAVVSTVLLSDSTGADIGFPSRLAHGWNGQIIVASNGGSFDGSDENILIVDPVTEQIVQRIVVAGGISDLAALDNGLLLVPVGFPGDDFTAAPVLQWIDPQTGSLIDQLPFDVDTSDFPAPSDLEILPDGTALMTIFGGSSVVYRIDVVNRIVIQEYPLESTDTIQSAVKYGGGDSFLVAEYFGGFVSRYSVSSGQFIEVLEGANLPNSIDVSGGRVFVAQQGMEAITVHAGVGSFVRGDVNLDLAVDLSDPIAVLQYLFLGMSISCLDSADTGDDGDLDISDVIHLLSFLFSEGAPPAYPYPVAGGDLSEDNLDCVN
ncbi:MAG: hypothetical protein AAEJ04_01580 [Planctomycetota bacterium]